MTGLSMIVTCFFALAELNKSRFGRDDESWTAVFAAVPGEIVVLCVRSTTTGSYSATLGSRCRSSTLLCAAPTGVLCLSPAVPGSHR